ncbi:MAG: RnfABCDGE type electron transport complex subunit G [Lachnospiraceae bacterium]|nr:RnfABCDGE type electron transport complex subunit G [Lachnospiraceae bacterium]
MKKGGFMKDAVILFAITLVSGLLLGGVYEMTKEPIMKAQLAASLEKYKLAYPDAADFKFDQAIQDQVAVSKETLAAEKPEFGGVEVDNALNAVDASGNVIGYIVTASSNDSYGGAVKVSVGITKEGMITGMEILEINDTPGLGMKAVEPEFKDQYKGKTVDEFSVTKGGSASDSEIDAISGATITSNAVTNAVNAALYFTANCIAK